MGVTRDRSLGRAIPRIPLLLFVALVVAIVGAVPGSQAGAAPKSPPGDPPGNNGTIKIERDAPNPPENEDEKEANNANEPHVDSCIFWVEFYGFDQGQTADITFTHVKSKKELVADKAVPISDDPAGGGQDLDNVIGYNLTSAVQGLEAHKKHGYHIKVASNSTGAPGGAKHKVFWIKCAPAPTTTLRVLKGIKGQGAGPFQFKLECNHRPLDRTFTLNGGDFYDVTGVPPGTTCAVIETNSNNAQISIEEKPATGPPVDGVVTLTAGTPVNVYVTNIFPGDGGTPPPPDSELRPPAGTQTGGDGTGGTAGSTGGAGGTTDVAGTTATNPGSSVLGSTATQPESTTTLPRTGRDPRPLTTTGLWALGAGGLALLGGRRRRRS